MPPLTQALILANVAAFALTYAIGPAMFEWFALWPLNSGLFLPWQIVTYAFLHGSVPHILFNMWGLWMFGSELERVWGAQRLGVFYTVSVLTAAATQLLVTFWTGSPAPTVGASGGLFGLLIALTAAVVSRLSLIHI